MKKLLGLVVAGLLLAGPALAQVTLSVSNVAIRPGDTGAVELRVNEAVKIGGIRANVSYGSLTPGKATLGDIWQDNRTSTQIDTSNPDFPAAGQVQVAVFSPTFGQAPGSVFSLPVTVPASTPLGTKIPVTLTVVEILDENNKDIPAGSVTIQNGSVTANPPPEVYITSPGGKPGDRTFVNIAVNEGLARIGGISLSLDLGPLVVDGPPTADGAFTNPGDVVLEFSPKDAVGKAPGVLQIGTLTPSFAAGPGTLITLPVRIPASAPSGTAIPIVLTLKEIIDDKNVDIPGVKVTSGSITPGVGGAPEISIVGVDAAPGANTTVNVHINEGLPKVGSAHVTVDLGSLVLAGPPVAGDAFADKGKVVLEFDPKDAVGKSGQKIQIGVVSGDAATGPGTLITIPVTIPADAVIGTPIPVGLTLQEIIDDKNADIPGVSVKSGSVTPKRALAQVRTPQSPVPNTIVVGTVAAKPVVAGQEPTDALLTVTGVNTDNLAGLDLTIEYDPAVITFVEPVAPTKPTDSIIPNPSGTDIFVTANPNYSPAGNAPPAGKRWLKLVVTGNTGTAKGVSGPLVTLKWRAAGGAATYDSAPLSFVTQGGIVQQMVLGDAAATAVDLTAAQLHSGSSVIVNATAGFSVQLGNLASGSATAFGQTLYVVDDGGMLRAFKLGTAVAGFDPVNVGSPILGRPTYRNGSLYVLTSAGRVVKADATVGGTPKWSKDLGSTASTSTPAVFNDKVYVGLNDGRVVSLADADGAIVDQWTADAADGPIVSGPSVGGSGVWVGTNGGSLYALNATLQVQSKITIAPSAGDLLAQLSSSPFIVAGDGQGQAFVGGTDGKVHRFNASTGGNEVASPAGPAPIFAPVFVLGNLVYALDEAETVRVIDASTMAETTSKDFGTRALDAQAPIRAGYDPAGSDANLYVPDMDGNLRIVKTDGTLELLGKPVLFAAQVSAPAITNFIRDVTDVVAAVNSDGSLVAIPIWGTPPTPPPPSTGGLPGPDGNGKVDMNVTDTTASLSNTITGAAGSEVTVQVNVDADAKNLQGVEFVLDSSEKSAGAPDLTGKVTSGTQVQVDLGSIFTPGGAIPPLVLGNQVAAGQVKVVLAYLNTDKPGNGPGPIVSVPLEIPASAPAGSTWTLRLTGVSVNGDTVLTTGNLGTATVKVEGTTPPPPTSDGKVDLTVGDTTGATTITAKAGDEVMLAINADVDAKNVQGVELVLDTTEKSAGAPDLTGKVTSGTQVTANLGSMFTPGGAIPPLVLGNQAAAGQIKVVVAYLNTDKPANGPGQLVTVPVEIPATAPAGSTWTVKLTGVSVSADTPLANGTTGTATIKVEGTPPPPTGDGKVDLTVGDTTGATTITAKAGDEVMLAINADVDAKNVQGVELVLDTTEKSAGAPDLTGKVASGTQVTANLGSMFTPGGAIPPLVLGNQAAAGQIKVVIAYLNTDKPANGPGQLVTVPVEIPATAPAGSTWTVKLTGVSVSADTPLANGTTGTATIKVEGTPPPPTGDGKVDLTVGDTTGATTITAKAGDEVMLAINADVDAKNVQGVELVLDTTEKSAGAPDLTGKVSSGTQVTANLGSMFTPGGAIPPLVLGNQAAAGQIKVVIAYLNTDKPANGPGQLVTVPVEIPATAPAGSTWTVKLTGVSVSADTPLANGTTGTATIKVEGTTPPPPPTSDGKVDLTLTDTTGATAITAKAGDEVMLAVNADVDAKNVQGVELVLDSTQKSAGAPDLTGKVASGTQVTANLGSMFTPGGAIPPLVLGNQAAAGQIKVVVAYLNTDKPANGPGQLVTVPVEVPATAPAGASWTVKLTGVSVSADNTLTIGTTGTVTISIAGTPPPPPPAGGGLPGPAGDAKVDMNITDTTAALGNIITGAAGSEVTVQINVDADAKNLQGVELVLDSTEKSAGAPDLTGKVASGTQVTANLGGIFTPGGPIPALVLANQAAAGQIKLVLAYLNTDKPGNGPGSILSVPLEIPAGAPAGATWTLKLTGVTVNGDTDLPVGTLGTATVKVGS